MSELRFIASKTQYSTTHESYAIRPIYGKEAAPFRLKVLYYKRTASTKWENTVLSCRIAVVWETYWKQGVAKKSKHD